RSSDLTENVGALVDRVMTLLRRVDDQISRRRAHTAIFDTRCNSISSALQRDEVRFRTTTRQRAKALWTIIQQIAKPAHDASLDHCRRWTIAPRARVLIEHRSQGIRPDADRQRCRVELSEVARVWNAHRVRRDIVTKTRKYLLDRDSLLRQRFVEEFFELRDGGFRSHPAVRKSGDVLVDNWW